MAAPGRLHVPSGDELGTHGARRSLRGTDIELLQRVEDALVRGFRQSGKVTVAGHELIDGVLTILVHPARGPTAAMEVLTTYLQRLRVLERAVIVSRTKKGIESVAWPPETSGPRSECVTRRARREPRPRTPAAAEAPTRTHHPSWWVPTLLGRMLDGIAVVVASTLPDWPALALTPLAVAALALAGLGWPMRRDDAWSWSAPGPLLATAILAVSGAIVLAILLVAAFP